MLNNFIRVIERVIALFEWAIAREERKASEYLGAAAAHMTAYTQSLKQHEASSATVRQGKSVVATLKQLVK